MILDGDFERVVALEPETNGYHAAVVSEVRAGERYRFRLDGDRLRPDPASRSQPEGVHGPSEVVSPEFAWTDEAWTGLELADYVLYELHVGTFTSEGTFEAAIRELDRLVGLGVTAIEIMPVAQFPGERNWGYDGVYPFAVQSSYGGVSGLKALVNACHARRLAVVLDVVYNHLGPEGNYLRDFGPYFTDQYKTPWGEAVNFDGPGSDPVRAYFLANALRWQTEFHIDALRLDAVHAIKDFSAYPFLAELADATRRRAQSLGRRFNLIAESDLNDSRLVRPAGEGGFGLDATWSDDFHHAVHALLTGERDGYYADFGTLHHLAQAYRDGFTYSGQESVFRGRRHGNSPDGLAPWRFVVCGQNHDQVGNRALGERFTDLLDRDSLKLAAGLVLLSPYVPLIFMGEEYAEEAPFLYFVSHGDPDLVESVRRGRREEFWRFTWPGDVPDPQAEATFRRSKLTTTRAASGFGQTLHRFYQELLRWRRDSNALGCRSTHPAEVTVREAERVLMCRRVSATDEAFLVFHLGGTAASLRVPWPQGHWRKRVDSALELWDGPGSYLPDEIGAGGEGTHLFAPRSLVVYQRVS